MAALHELIQKIENPELRAQIQAAADKLTKQKKFGLVFEEHLPECTPLYDIPVRKGSKVSVRDEKANETYTVLKIEDGKALCLPKNSKEAVEFDLCKLVTTAELGDPIYPYLQSLEEVCNAPDSDLWHALIEADNYHALQLLEYLYAGKVDCIYIDPPYNTGARDWKYNNDYVDGNDEYRHSKWLSFMQKRLLIAKKLLNASDSVMIIAIDDKEYLHLGCLLEDLFPEAKITMISTVINPVGKAKKGGTDFSRTDEYLFFLQFGTAAIQPEIRETSPAGIRWQTFRRSSLANGRGKHGVGACGPNQFYPIYVNDTTHQIVEVGYPIPEDVDRFTVKQIEGCTAVFPVRKDGSEINWGATREKVLELMEKGYFKVIPKRLDEPQQYKIKYLTSGVIKDIEEGRITITGRDETGCVVGYYDVGKEMVPTTHWSKPSHNATSNGTDLLTKLFITPRFDYAKSLYAEHDAIRCAVAHKPNALIVDFFAGSGTTLHAVNLLNAEDGGVRRCIMVTNNEISEEERLDFKSRGIRHGDIEWDSRGVARYVTWPRTICSIKGININGEPLQDDYITTATITQTTKRRVHQISFIANYLELSLSDKKKVIELITNKVLPGKLVDEESDYIVSDLEKHTATVLINTDLSDEWIDELVELEHITDFYVITSDKKTFNRIKRQVLEKVSLIQKTIPMKIPMSDGFKSNAVFFKLGFLDKTKVSLGMQFKELVSTLWMKAGAIGKCPIIDSAIPAMLILPENRMAVLNDENRFGEFAEQIVQHPEINVVYLVTDYESSFVAMTQVLEGKTTYQLYRDYLDNFRINAGRNGR